MKASCPSSTANCGWQWPRLSRHPSTAARYRLCAFVYLRRGHEAWLGHSRSELGQGPPSLQRSGSQACPLEQVSLAGGEAALRQGRVWVRGSELPEGGVHGRLQVRQGTLGRRHCYQGACQPGLGPHDRHALVLHVVLLDVQAPAQQLLCLQCHTRLAAEEPTRAWRRRLTVSGCRSRGCCSVLSGGQRRSSSIVHKAESSGASSDRICAGSVEVAGAPGGGCRPGSVGGLETGACRR